MIPVFFFAMLINFSIGCFCGWICGRTKREVLDEEEKLDIYCAAWQDSIYNILQEYDDRYYIKERALDGFKEFQSHYKKAGPH